MGALEPQTGVRISPGLPSKTVNKLELSSYFVGIMVAEGSASVEKWLSRLAPSTARMNRHEHGYFMKWLESNGTQFSDYTPDQLVEYQRKATNERARHLEKRNLPSLAEAPEVPDLHVLGAVGTMGAQPRHRVKMGAVVWQESYNPVLIPVSIIERLR